MTMFTSRTINFFNLMKRLGQVLLLFVLGACLLILSTLLVSASGQWGWLALGILVVICRSSAFISPVFFWRQTFLSDQFMEKSILIVALGCCHCVRRE
ncbi:hypothetical protein ACP3V3_10955 [Vibrio sp. PNB22_3_1]|uniref:hypothetical protein n=1 Tax=Vibrio TaxID=662 RepID=UPI00406772F2